MTVKPYSAESLTLQEAPSFAWRTNGAADKLRAILARPLPGEGLKHLVSVSLAKAVTGGSSA